MSSLQEALIKYKNILNELELKAPLVNQYKIIELMDFNNLSDELRKKSIIILCKTDLKQIGGSFIVRKIKDKTVFFLTYNKDYDEDLTNLINFKKLRKANIIHEFCHFIAFANQIHKLDYNKIFDDYSEQVKNDFSYSMFLDIIIKINKNEFKEYFDTHFKYAEDDNIDYGSLYERLLLLYEELVFVWDELESKKVINKFHKTKDTISFNKWYDIFIKRVEEEYLVYRTIIEKRLVDEIQYLMN